MTSHVCGILKWISDLYLSWKMKFSDSSRVPAPYSAGSTSESLCLVLNSKGLGHPKLPTRVCQRHKGVYDADTTVMKFHCLSSFCTWLCGWGSNFSTLLVKSVHVLLWWLSAELQLTVPISKLAGEAAQWRRGLGSLQVWKGQCHKGGCDEQVMWKYHIMKFLLV